MAPSDPVSAAAASPVPTARRWRPLRVLGVALALLVVVALAVVFTGIVTEWRALRGPAAALASRALHRAVTIGELSLHVGRPIRLTIRDLTVADVDWAGPEPMARLDRLEAWIAPGPLLRGRIVLPRVAAQGLRAALRRREDGSDNWHFGADDTRTRPPARLPAVGKATLDDAVVRIDDGKTGLQATWRPRTAPDDDANEGFVLRHAFDGHYRDGRFAGTALTGLPFDVTGRPDGGAFPLRFDLVAGRTRVTIDGRVLDPAAQGVDLDLSIAGPTLANLYPFLLLPLPASPPYELRGRLRRDGARFELSSLEGRIGGTDVAGSARYEQREPRPRLEADLHSRTLNLADLGPLVGVEDAGTPARRAAARQGGAGFSDRGRAIRSERRAAGGDANRRLLPSGSIGGERLALIDAHATLEAGEVRGAGTLALRDLALTLTLQDAVLRVAPLTLGVAQGRLDGTLAIDGRERPTRGEATLRLQGARLGTLVPKVRDTVAASGRLGGTLALSGRGDSVGALLGRANGEVQFATHGGHLSTLMVAALGLDAAEVLKFLAIGDRPTPLRCAVGLFDVREGIAQPRVLVVDTDDTRIDGDGRIDFGRERLDLTFRPQPKDPSPLSLRAPLRLTGSFAHPKADVDRGQIAARAGAALLLGVVATPLAALLPLIETGTGDDAPCAALVARAHEAGHTANATGRTP